MARRCSDLNCEAALCLYRIHPAILVSFFLFFSHFPLILSFSLSLSFSLIIDNSLSVLPIYSNQQYPFYLHPYLVLSSRSVSASEFLNSPLSVSLSLYHISCSYLFLSLINNIIFFSSHSCLFCFKHIVQARIILSHYLDVVFKISILDFKFLYFNIFVLD